MRIGGAKTEKEFYEMYPTEEEFLMKHGGAINKLMAGGGEAYPQTATMDNFFSYGVPVPPTYYRQGGAFPMAQSEEQFFSPFYGNVPNPYNKAMGGSSEAYPQSMSFPYGNTGRSTHFMMQDGGDMPEEQTLPKMGVNGKLLEFVGTIKNTAANKLNSNLAKYGKVKNPEQYEFEQAKYGGNLRSYQSKNSSSQTDPLLDRVTKSMGDDPLFTNRMNLPQLDYNSDKGTVNNYYYGPGAQGPGGGPYFDGAENGLPPEYYNDIDYLRGRRRPLSDFNIRGRGMFGNYSSTGWLKDEYGMDRLREMGLTRMDQSNPRWWQLMKRPTQTYYFGNQGQGPMGYVPGQVDQQGMPIANQQGPAASATPGANGTGVTPNNQTPPNKSDQGKGMGFFARLFNKEGNMAPDPAKIVKDYTDVTPDQNTIVDTNNPAGWNPYMSDFRNQIVQNRRRRTFDKLADLTAHETWQKDMLGKAYDAMEYKPQDASGQEISRDKYSDIGLQGRRGRKEDRLIERALKLDRKVNAQRFQGKDTSSEKESRREKRIREQTTSPSSYQQYRKPMTLDEYNKQKEIEARDRAGIEQQIKDSNNPDTPMAPMQGVVDRQQIGNQPVGGTTIIPFVMPPSSSNSKPSFYTPGANMFDDAEYITTDPIDFDSTNTQHRAAMMKAILDGATDDTYDDLMPGMKNKKYGGSYNTGDVVDMTPEELKRFIEMGGQVEFLD